MVRGEIVRSLRGHDAGGHFCILNTEADFVYLADGKRRKVTAPKRKRVRHVEAVGSWSHPVTDRIAKGEAVMDSEIRRALAAFRDSRFHGTKEV